MQLSHLSHKSLDFIYGIERSKKVFNLSNIKRFLKKLNNPEKNLKIIHVAGTNGKGSVCAMISSTLVQAGYNVGMYTSPHLIKINERIQINNITISDKDMDRLAVKIKRAMKKHKINLTFFETLTVIALLYFKENKVDCVVLETGMGGRLDATNVVTPILSVITNIGKDHKDVLGRTIKQISIEKAGIIKKNIPVITNAKGTALKIIKGIAKKNKSELIKIQKLPGIKVGLPGHYQLENAATAYTALKYLEVDKKYIKAGLKKVYWPGRFEKIGKNILLDCAHNPDGIRALVDSVHELHYDNIIVILGTMGDKDVKSMADELKDLSRNVILTKINMTKAIEPENLAKYFPISIITHNLEHAVAFARKFAKTKDLILVTGSIYLAGEALSLLRNH